MDILKILQKGECKTVEFKRDISSPVKILRTVVAFTNTSGGVIVIGVDNKGVIKGITEPLKIEESLTNTISDSISPQLIPNIEIISWRNKELIVIEIFPGNQRPYFLKSKGLEIGAYVRIGSSNRCASKEIIQELKRYSLNRSFDEEPFLETSSEGLDIQTISECLSRIGKKATNSTLKTLRLETSFNNKTVPTNGAYILFGRDRLSFFPDASIKGALFSGTDKSEMLDSVDIEDSMVKSIEQGMAFIKRSIPKRSKIEGLYRKDTFCYPMDALREALINSVVHCDYSLHGTQITMAIFNDRIEITNPGSLPFGMTIDDLFRGVSKLRNRVIGRFFKEIKLIEQWGIGIGKIIKECRNAGLPDPKFEEIGMQFRVTLYGAKSSRHKLSGDERKIIEALRNGKGLSTKDIARIINKTERTARTKMLKLLEQGLVVEIGSGSQDPNKKYILTG